MAIYHCSIKVIGKGGGRSVVAASAYRSGKSLKSEMTGEIYDFTNKGGVIMSEILLPEFAPQRFLDREVLWNAVEKNEHVSNAQFAREIEAALPKEMSREEQIECARSFIKENFIREGMIADWALHDKEDGNPHVHILLTLRALDEKGNWKNKKKEVFANAHDKNGKPIYDPTKPLYDPKNKVATEKYRFPKLDENGVQKVRHRKGKGEEKLWEKVQISLYNWDDHRNAEK